MSIMEPYIDDDFLQYFVPAKIWQGDIEYAALDMIELDLPVPPGR